jgi:hypothetical protein
MVNPPQGIVESNKNMSLRLHPHLGALWIIVFACEAFLAYRATYTPATSLFRWYVFLIWLRDGALIIFSAANQPHAYYYTFWYAEFLFHALVLAMFVMYTYRVVGKQPRLPEGFPLTAALVSALVVLAYVAIRWWAKAAQDPDRMMAGNAAFEAWAAGAFWIVWLAGLGLRSRSPLMWEFREGPQRTKRVVNRCRCLA